MNVILKRKNMTCNKNRQECKQTIHKKKVLMTNRCVSWGNAIQTRNLFFLAVDWLILKKQTQYESGCPFSPLRWPESQKLIVPVTDENEEDRHTYASLGLVM